jgi:hypothetical protein
VSSCPALLQESGWRLILPEVRLRLDAQHDNWKRQSHPADQQARKRGRSKYFPVAPTLAEQGYPEATVTPWFGFVIPAKTPQPVLDKISKALDTALADADAEEARYGRLRARARTAESVRFDHRPGRRHLEQGDQGREYHRRLNHDALRQ